MFDSNFGRPPHLFDYSLGGRILQERRKLTRNETLNVQ